MYHEGTPDFFIDQGLYYPASTNYGYIYTGYESISDWEDHHRNFGLDAQNVQYTPSYGYAQSAYNPYNPYIPGAIIGADGSFLVPYYTLPSYETPDSFVDTSVPLNKVDSQVAKHNFSSYSPNYSQNASSRRNSFVHKVRPKDDAKVNPDEQSEQNSGSRMYKPKNQLVVKAYTTRAGNPDAQGNIIVYKDQYNKFDFPLVYANAKFFVIKSYSEDDVHKSIKFNVWSSTTNGNKKLNTAYEVAKGDSRGCPIFLFFSVNASGQFCGVAEMTGPVDLHKDMDFWQQDKWSGSFPVKWHFIKDVPNPIFRHIILENNENNPVTHSRDTQEIPYKKGLEMLKIFKNHTLKTSLLDDFMYYENRQRIMKEERARILKTSYENPHLVPVVNPPRKLHSLHDFPSIGDINAVTKPDADNLDTNVPTFIKELKLASLSINSEESKSAESEVVTIGSMPVKVNGAHSSGFLTVGTIPLDPRALQCDY